MGHYTVIYDVATNGYTNWRFAAFGLIFVAIGIVQVVLPNALEDLSRAFVSLNAILNPLLGIPLFLVNRATARPRNRPSVFSWGWLGFSVLWTFGALGLTFYLHLADVKALHDGKFAVVNGAVSNLTDRQLGVTDFRVGDKVFQYTDLTGVGAVLFDFLRRHRNDHPLIPDRAMARISYSDTGHVLRAELWQK